MPRALSCGARGRHMPPTGEPYREAYAVAKTYTYPQLPFNAVSFFLSLAQELVAALHSPLESL